MPAFTLSLSGLLLDITKEVLQTAPSYSYDHTKNVWLPATKQG